MSAAPPRACTRLCPSGSVNDLVATGIFVSLTGINVLVVGVLHAAMARVLAQEQNLRVLIESAPNGIVVVDDHGTISLVNATTERLFGYARADLMGKKIELLVPDQHTAGHITRRQGYNERPQLRAMGGGRDLNARRKDGSEFPVEVGLNPVQRRDGPAVLATVVDISERKQAQERQRFLLYELQHRARNLFAVVQSIAARTFAGDKPISEAREAFSGRLRALARAHTMLADAVWKGARLAEIIEQEFAGFAPAGLTSSGCDIYVNAT